ncbi:hypothetical protein [Denitratimonas sp. CY0512]|uniref:hypothetical protein n=1 Tax=Denitratimonas sp. CY0512 TaxID=3131940 RepID=UPI0030A18041
MATLALAWRLLECWSKWRVRHFAAPPRRRPPLEARIMKKRHAYVTDSLEIADRCVKEARRLGLS